MTKTTARPAPYRGDASRGEIEILEPRQVFANAFVEVYNDRVRFPDGHEGENFRWHWTAPYGVIALPRLPDGSVLLIEQFRHIDRAWRIEAPRGFGSAHETPAAAAQREVEEETGQTVRRVHPLRSLGHSRYPVHLFLVDIDPAASAAPSNDDPREAIAAHHRFRAAEIPALLQDPRIHDAETLVLLAACLSAP
jgi:8-oxo-dGTP pyrophosphatase MutT (NUDIX family)